MSDSCYKITEYTRDENDIDKNRRWIKRERLYNNFVLNQEDEFMSVMNTDNNRFTEDARYSLEKMINFGTACIAEMDGRFYLLVELETNGTSAESGQVAAVRITPAQAEALQDANIKRCK